MKELLLKATNALTLADELLDLAIRDGGDELALAAAQLLRCELKHVLGHARQAAGLNPDGSFDQVPRPRPPATNGTSSSGRVVVAKKARRP